MNADNYVVGAQGRVLWRERDREHVEHKGGPGTLVAIVRGHGDHAEVAGIVAAQVLAKLRDADPPKDPAKALRRFVLDAHAQLAGTAARKYASPVGASLSAVWVVGRTAGWVSVGGTRLYLVRGGRITRLSADQTLDEFARRDGRPCPEDGARLAQQFIRGGDGADLRVDRGLDSGVEALQVGDRLLLTTPGVHDAVDDASLADVLAHVPEPQAASVMCMERAIARGSVDNLGAIVARVDG